MIKLLTEVPGPRSRELWQRRARAVPRGLAATAPIFIERAQGAVLTDVDGNQLVDFAGGIGTVNAGHRHPQVQAAALAQLGRLTHSCFTVAGYEPYVALAERLNALTPGRHDKRTFFTNSGAEAVENAVKAARAYTGRQAVLCFEHGFHGRTQLALTLTSKVVPYKRGFGPFAPEVYRLPYPYCYRCDRAAAGSPCCRADRDAFERSLAAVVDPGALAAIVIELQTGEGGFIPAPPEYVRMLAAFARDHGIVFVADEVQTGLGRTGKLFLSEHHGLVPDVIVLAKSLAAGLPLGAVTGRAEILDAAQPGGLGGTFGGNPVACAAALAVLDVMLAEDLPGRAARLGAILRERFEAWARAYPYLGDVRGVGAMMALELVRDRGGKGPDQERCQRVLSAALARGLLLLSAGTYGNVIRVLCPLIIEDEVLEEGLAVLGQALEACA